MAAERHVDGRRRVSVVTGGGSGIGQAVAVALAAEGDAVVVAGRRADALAETVSLAGDTDGEVTAVTTDVRDPASVAELFTRTEERYGRLDLLFNNAGASAPPVPLDELDVDDARRTWARHRVRPDRHRQREDAPDAPDGGGHRPARRVHPGEPVMDVDDVVRAVVYMASLPLGANVPFLTVMATEMPWIGRG